MCDEYAIVDWQSPNLMKNKITEIEAFCMFSNPMNLDKTNSIFNTKLFLKSINFDHHPVDPHGVQVFADMAEEEPSTCQLKRAKILDG